MRIAKYWALYQSLHVNIPSLVGVVVFIVTIQFHQLSIFVQAWLRNIIMPFVGLQIVNAKRGSADTTPGIMRSFPRLATEKWFATRSYRFFLLHKDSKICADQVVIGFNIELAKQELCSPPGILYMKNPQYSFGTTVLLL